MKLSIGRFQWRSTTRSGLAPAVVVITALVAFSSGPVSGQAADGGVTFTRDVAPILQENCQTCHRIGSIAPMPLTTYEQVRPFAPLIREKVASRTMPPWPLDHTVGIQDFKNDVSLTDEEIQTIVGWVDAGAPMGDPMDSPPQIEWAAFENDWQYEERFGRPPDIVIASPAYTVPANELDHWPNLLTAVPGLTDPRWIRAVEIRPGDAETRYVFHHANPSILQEGGNVAVGHSAAGTVGYIFPDDTGQSLKPGAEVRFGMHLFPIDRDVNAVLQLGFWLYPEGEVPEFETPGEVIYEASQSTGFGHEATSSLGFGPTRGMGGGRGGTSSDAQMPRQTDLLIPPHSVATFRGVYVMDRAARIHSVRGHMHLRGKYQIIEAVYPDGRWEVINKLNWHHGWQTAFLYEDHVMPLLPKGTVLMVTNIFDNTADNPHNPDPNQWAVRGDRTVDEMSHTRIGITYFDDEEDFERLVRERARILAERADGRSLQASR
jgi:hypothetical protein